MKNRFIGITIIFIMVLNVVLPIASYAVENENIETINTNIQDNEEINETNTVENETDIVNNEIIDENNIVEENNVISNEIEENVVEENITNNNEIEEKIISEEEIITKESYDFDDIQTTSLSVAYMSYVDGDWQSPVVNGVTSGTEGENKPIQAIKIKLLNAPTNAKVKYKVFTQNEGYWQSIVSNGEIAGGEYDWEDSNTENINNKIFAFGIELENMSQYSIQYRGHISDVGWTDWSSDGAIIGTIDSGKQVEALQVRIVSKIEKEISVSYKTFVENSNDWQNEVSNGQTSGTVGQNCKMFGIQIRLTNSTLEGSIQYSVHVEDEGWIDYVSEGEIAGFISEGKKIEAIKIQLVNLYDYDVSYRAHVQDIGWQNWYKNGQIAGTTGKNLKIEAIQIKVSKKTTDVEKTPGVIYRSHVQDIGWQDGVTNGTTSGTVGKNKKIEAMLINIYNVPIGSKILYSSYLEGMENWTEEVSNYTMTGTTGENRKMYAIKISLENLEGYSVKYRVHMQDIGWQEWKKDGEIAGSTTLNKKIEAIEIKLIRKETSSLMVKYDSHVQDIGWEEDFACDGDISGTTGQNKKIEAMHISIVNGPSGSGIEYKSYLDGTGWQEWKADGAQTGTTGQDRRMYGIAIKLKNMSGYSIQYRVHVEDYGWDSWKVDGEIAGYPDESKKIEAIQIRIIFATISGSIDTTTVKYMTSYGSNWEDEYSCYDGMISGTTGKNRALNGIKINLTDTSNSRIIKYKTHVGNEGWQSNWSKNGEISGSSTGKNNVEAIVIALDNVNLTVEYRVHISGIGWQEWKKDGEQAGTTGQSRSIEAIQIRIISKYKSQYYGIDVSSHNEVIDWNQVKASGQVDFAIIRLRIWKRYHSTRR